MNKIKFIHLLHEHAGLSLKESKNTKDRIVDGETVEIVVDRTLCTFIISQSLRYGVEAIIVD